MAAPTAGEAAALLADAKCDICYMPPGLVWYSIIAALIHIANGEAVPTAQTLVSETGCLECVIPPGLVPYAILQALRDISTGGAGGGQSGSGSPEGVKTANPGGTYWDVTGQSLWVKNTGTGTTGWVQVIA